MYLSDLSYCYKNVLPRKLDSHMQKNEIIPLSYTTLKKITQGGLKT